MQATATAAMSDQVVAERPVPEAASAIYAAPQAGQIISHAGHEYTTIKEGLAHILVPRGTPTSTDPKLSKEEAQKQQVFYNPIQQLDRKSTRLNSSHWE